MIAISDHGEFQYITPTPSNKLLYNVISLVTNYIQWWAFTHVEAVHLTEHLHNRYNIVSISQYSWHNYSFQVKSLDIEIEASFSS